MFSLEGFFAAIVAMLIISLCFVVGTIYYVCLNFSLMNIVYSLVGIVLFIAFIETVSIRINGKRKKPKLRKSNYF